MATACVILAAGMGTRMKSRLPKVLHRLCGMPMIQCVIDAAQGLRPERTIVVAGEHIDAIRDAVSAPGIGFVRQSSPKGTGHAVLCAMEALDGFRGNVVIVNGDTPLVGASALKRFLALHAKGRSAVSVLSFIASAPDHYGRIVRDSAGKVVSIVEHGDADEKQRTIREVNSGVYAVRHDALGLLGSIAPNTKKGEYFLTDIVALSADAGFKTAAYPIGEEEEFMGVNTREELYRAACIMRRNIVRNWTEKGVSFVDTETVYIDRSVTIGRETKIYPNVYLEGKTKIGADVIIYPNVRVLNGFIADRAVIYDSTVIEDSVVRKDASVGPFARLRPGSDIGEGARVGNFVELKKAVLGRRSKASHLSYLGDASIGSDVNIGAGTITCNYDGLKKHATIIKDGVFIGSDTQLVAPVSVGRGSYVGAGSTVTKDVPAGALALSRIGQRIIPGWAKKRSAGRKQKS